MKNKMFEYILPNYKEYENSYKRATADAKFSYALFTWCNINLADFTLYIDCACNDNEIASTLSINKHSTITYSKYLKFDSKSLVDTYNELREYFVEILNNWFKDKVIGYYTCFTKASDKLETFDELVFYPAVLDTYEKIKQFKSSVLSNYTFCNKAENVLFFKETTDKL